jgi:hypothetical protein
MAVLLMIGRGQEEPAIVDHLLDIEQCPNRPLYGIASEAFLVFHRCQYEPELQFRMPAGSGLADLLSEQAARASALSNIHRLALSEIGSEFAHPQPATKHVSLRLLNTEK